MCRFHQLWGCAISAFGLGILVGIWLGGGFLCCCLGAGLIIAGILVLKNKPS